jgi:hypothetical protein
MERPFLVGLFAAVLSVPVAVVLFTHHSRGSVALADTGSPRPTKLTPAQKAELAGRPVVASGAYVDVSPAQPTAAHGRLELVRSVVVGDPPDAARVPGTETFVAVPNASTPHASLHIVPDGTTTRYLVDCLVDGGQEYFVRTWPGGGAQTFGAGQHVLVTLDVGAGYEGDVEVALAGKAARGAQGWLVYGCDVTKL